MAENLYDILGVPQRASDDEIRRAFRKLAKENHPDVNPGNGAAAERFKKITAANEILGDAGKRRLYDAGQIDSKGEATGPRWRPGATGQARGRSQGMDFDDLGFSGIFSDVFGGGRGAPFGSARSGAASDGRGQDMRYSLELDFIEAINGAKKRVTLPAGGVLDLTVPEGVSDGQTLRLKGKGAPGRGADAGDALVEIKIKPHPEFSRSGDDIMIELPISIDEAVLGGRIEVPTVSGRVQLSIPKGTSSGKTFRLKGKGVRTRAGGHGDELVTVRIVLPNDIDDSLSYFFSEWRQKNGYNPGRK